MADALHSFLISPDSYPQATSQVTRIETHISEVYLTDQLVYKLKKPVRFDFLDFSTVELRHQACLEELSLNRRLAPDVYLDVLPIVRLNDGRLQIGGEGDVVDWLVKMRRLEEPDTLRASIERGEPDSVAISALAERLADFYREQSPLPIAGPAYRQVIEEHVRGNRAELLQDEKQFAPHIVRRIHAAQLCYLKLYPELFDARVAAGRIVDGHGDLRPEHVYLTSPPVVIDCIEFNAEFRHLDVLDELSFLETECALLGAENGGIAVRQQVLQILGDEAPPPLAAFYKSYRACVRAKVAALRARQLSVEAAAASLVLARNYLELADQFDEALGPPLLILVRGVSGTGKSTLAKELSQQLGIEILQTDALRQGLVQSSQLPAEAGEEKYRSGARQQVYEAMFDAAAELLAQQSPVILDGTFLSQAQRQRVADLAARYQVRWLIVHCECPTDVSQRRITARLKQGTSRSEAKPDLVPEQKSQEERDLPPWPAVYCDTTEDLQTLVTQVLGALSSQRV
jgi:aminoglycoside phosphotransferase family enzyme/predicted kinase